MVSGLNADQRRTSAQTGGAKSKLTVHQSTMTGRNDSTHDSIQNVTHLSGALRYNMNRTNIERPLATPKKATYKGHFANSSIFKIESEQSTFKTTNLTDHSMV